MGNRHQVLYGALLLVFLLTACQPVSAPTSTPLPPETTEPTAPASGPVTGPARVPVKIQDTLGRTVLLETFPRRIVIAGRAIFMIADAVYMFPQARERVVGVVRAQQATERFLTLLAPDYASKVVLEPDAGAEQIASLQPDVVILKSYMQDTLGKTLEELGIPVIYVDFETPEKYSQDLKTLGQLFGDAERAVDLALYYERRLSALRETVAKATVHPRVLLVRYQEKNGEVSLSVPPANWIQTQMVMLSGGEPVWREAAQGGGWVTVNFEQIAAWDPDLIAVISYNKNVDEVMADLRASEQWQALRAVKEGRFYGFPGDFYSWDQPDARWMLGLTWLAAKIQPDLVQPDLLNEIYTFYREIYGLDETIVREQILPLLSGDVGELRP